MINMDYIQFRKWKLNPFDNKSFVLQDPMVYICNHQFKSSPGNNIFNLLIQYKPHSKLNIDWSITEGNWKYRETYNVIIQFNHYNSNTKIKSFNIKSRNCRNHKHALKVFNYWSKINDRNVKKVDLMKTVVIELDNGVIFKPHRYFERGNNQIIQTVSLI